MALEITYHAQAFNKNMYGPAIISETRTLSGTSGQSAATPSNAEIVSLHATEDCRYAYGTNPTATATAGVNGHFLPAGTTKDIQAVPGWKIAGIQAA